MKQETWAKIQARVQHTRSMSQCTADNPMPKGPEVVLGKWYHNGAEEVPGTRDGNSVLYRCPHCHTDIPCVLRPL